jgi:hypothetical protein
MMAILRIVWVTGRFSFSSSEESQCAVAGVFEAHFLEEKPLGGLAFGHSNSGFAMGLATWGHGVGNKKAVHRTQRLFPF